MSVAKPIRFVLVGALFLALSGCTATGFAHPDSPRVNLVHIKPADVKLFEQRYVLTLRIQNPNPEPLRIRGMDYAIELNGEEFATGVSGKPVDVAAYGVSVVQVEVTSNLARVIEQVRKLGRTKKPIISYGISGRLSLEGVPGRVPFEFTDELNLDPRDDRSLIERSI